jgi:nucleoside-diphosphate-sugar epimerase
MKKIIVGATGYIGNLLFVTARKNSHACGTSSNKNNKDYDFLDLNAANVFVDKFIKMGDVVFLTAAISAPDVCALEKERAWRINVEGTSEFIRSVIVRGGRVIFFSSDTVYGECKDEFDERFPSKPAGEYASMKNEVEQRFFGNPAFKSIRLSYVFSREDKLTRYLIGCVEKNEVAELFHPFYRSFVHRDDVVAGALALSEIWDEIPEQFINFGGPQVLSRIEFAECLREVHLHDLRFSVTQPDEAFFHNRPRIIAMASPVLRKLLSREPRSLSAAARLEFGATLNF